MVNPDGVNDIPAVVHDSTVFPISTGNWLANTPTSKWISPVANTAASVGEDIDAGEGGGVYVYRLVVDATGFDPATISITGGWATDNLGTNIRVNGQDTGLTNTVQFPSLTAFTIDNTNATFVAGTNTIDFLVQNATTAVGPTGLRIQGLRGTGTLLANQPRLPAVTIAINASNQPVISFNGIAGTQYRVQRSTTLLDRQLVDDSYHHSRRDTARSRSPIPIHPPGSASTAWLSAHEPKARRTPAGDLAPIDRSVSSFGSRATDARLRPVPVHRRPGLDSAVRPGHRCWGRFPPHDLRNPEWLALLPVVLVAGWFVPRLGVFRPLRLVCLVLLTLILMRPQVPPARKRA